MLGVVAGNMHKFTLETEKNKVNKRANKSKKSDKSTSDTEHKHVPKQAKKDLSIRMTLSDKALKEVGWWL